jgi:3'-5' exoribonuclease
MQRLMHLVLSHHGDLDKGSPVRPQTPEAMLLHLIDMLDSQMGAVTRLAKNQDANGWSDYAKNFERRFYFGQAGEAAPAAVPVQAAHEVSGSPEPVQAAHEVSGSPVLGTDTVPDKPAKKPSLF